MDKEKINAMAKELERWSQYLREQRQYRTELDKAKNVLSQCNLLSGEAVDYILSEVERVADVPILPIVDTEQLIARLTQQRDQMLHHFLPLVEEIETSEAAQPGTQQPSSDLPKPEEALWSKRRGGKRWALLASMRSSSSAAPMFTSTIMQMWADELEYPYSAERVNTLSMLHKFTNAGLVAQHERAAPTGRRPGETELRWYITDKGLCWLSAIENPTTRHYCWDVTYEGLARYDDLQDYFKQQNLDLKEAIWPCSPVEVVKASDPAEATDVPCLYTASKSNCCRGRDKKRRKSPEKVATGRCGRILGLRPADFKYLYGLIGTDENHPRHYLDVIARINAYGENISKTGLCPSYRPLTNAGFVAEAQDPNSSRRRTLRYMTPEGYSKFYKCQRNTPVESLLAFPPPKDEWIVPPMVSATAPRMSRDSSDL